MKKKRINPFSLTPEERERRRKKNKRFNAILYTLSALLIVAGICVIINDQTLWLKSCNNKVKEKYNQIVNNETPVPVPTIPPFPAYTYDPDAPWNVPGKINEWWNYDPGATGGPVTDAPSGSGNAQPTPSGGGSQSDTFYDNPEPTPYNPYEPKNVYFVGYESTCPVCPVQPVGYNRYGQMAVVQSAYTAGWFRYGGDPVRGGNTLIAGHIRHKGKYGYFSIVRDKLKQGDYVIVEMQNGQYAYYVVSSIEKYVYNNVPSAIMTTGGSPRLTLITCMDDYSSYHGTSLHRVFAICYPVYFEDPNATEPPKTEPPSTPVIEVTPKPEQTAVPSETTEPVSAPPDPTRAP